MKAQLLSPPFDLKLICPRVEAVSIPSTYIVSCAVPRGSYVTLTTNTPRARVALTSFFALIVYFCLDKGSVQHIA